MKQILVATTNQGKLKEIQDIITEFKILSLADISCQIEVEEDQNTFAQNALKKAREIYKATKIPCIADDSGIEIEQYQGWPGVKTARFLGQDKASNAYAKERNEFILNKMKELPKQRRKVEYITTIAYVNGKMEIVETGVLKGYIATKPRGENGFGFDAIFELEEGKTLAQLTTQEKNEISSRKQALEKIKPQIK